MIVYTVHAYRWGDRENHSYIVGVYSTADKAIKMAEFEERYRGGKYECEVTEWEIDGSQWSYGRLNTIRPLPPPKVH